MARFASASSRRATLPLLNSSGICIWVIGYGCSNPYGVTPRPAPPPHAHANRDLRPSLPLRLPPRLTVEEVARTRITLECRIQQTREVGDQ